MIKALRKRIVMITLLSVGLVLAVMVGGVNIANYAQIIHKADNTLSLLAEHEGKFPIFMNPGRTIRPEERFETRFFSVLFSSNSTIQKIDVSSIYAVSSAQAVNYANTVLESGKTSGFETNYRFLVVEEQSSTRVIFIDIQRDMESFQNLLLNSLIISLVGFGAVIGLSIFFSKILLKPVEEAYDKQKRFITDASHELKTPITIIKTNMDVLSMKDADSKWIESTKRQTDRMSSMVNDLLFLSKMDETKILSVRETVDMKHLVEEVIADYQPIIGKDFDLKLSLDTSLCIGDPILLKRLVNVLVENAMRYGLKEHPLNIKLSTSKTKNSVLRITNASEITTSGNIDSIFDRFTRLDDSRNQKTGGSGIGLSIAKSIVDLHNGDIHATVNDQHDFTVTVKL